MRRGKASSKSIPNLRLQKILGATWSGAQWCMRKEGRTVNEWSWVLPDVSWRQDSICVDVCPEIKDQVFQRFLEWKALVERSTGRKTESFVYGQRWWVHVSGVRKLPQVRRSLAWTYCPKNPSAEWSSWKDESNSHWDSDIDVGWHKAPSKVLGRSTVNSCLSTKLQSKKSSYENYSIWSLNRKETKCPAFTSIWMWCIC